MPGFSQHPAYSKLWLARDEQRGTMAAERRPRLKQAGVRQQATYQLPDRRLSTVAQV
ncbi:uncharacterized protein CTRU02_207358 [Colletotrichum truncatum]|uniref:Uncharacterized protein n=1 Tax=Colletotrichum truncatum TaxID=5467 RepID=A0ACC3Z0L0_COLTU